MFAFGQTDSLNKSKQRQDTLRELPEIIIKHLTITGGENGLKELPGSAYYISTKELQKFNYSDNRINKLINA
jgi:hypothetical protein